MISSFSQVFLNPGSCCYHVCFGGFEWMDHLICLGIKVWFAQVRRQPLNWSKVFWTKLNKHDFKPNLNKILMISIPNKCQLFISISF